MTPPLHGPTTGPLWRGMVHFQLRSSFTERGKTFGRHPWRPYSDGNPLYSGVCPGSPRGSFTTMVFLPKCHAAFGPILATLAWVDHSTIRQCALVTLYMVSAVTTFYMIQGTDRHITMM